MARDFKAQNMAIKEAWTAPDRRWKINRNCAWVFVSSWSFFTNWKGFSLAGGEPRKRFNKAEVPASMWQVTFDAWPFRLLIFARNRRLVWIRQRTRL